MERILGKNSLAEELYKGNEIPEKHRWVEPTNMDHIFIGKPSNGAKVITVIAEDRWGSKYYEEIIL